MQTTSKTKRNRPFPEKWLIRVILFSGKVEMKWSSPQLGLDLYDKDAWIDLGWRENSCYADVKYCNQTGFTISFWVAFCEANSHQRLFEFGSGDCGLNLILTNESEIAATIKSMELRKIWTIVSGKVTIGVREWHHVTLTWNNSGDVYLFLNGTRYCSVDMYWGLCRKWYRTEYNVIWRKLTAKNKKLWRTSSASFLSVATQSFNLEVLALRRARRKLEYHPEKTSGNKKETESILKSMTP